MLHVLILRGSFYYALFQPQKLQFVKPKFVQLKT